MIKKIISGGLTVSDQAALDVAISLGITDVFFLTCSLMEKILTLT